MQPSAFHQTIKVMVQACNIRCRRTHIHGQVDVESKIRDNPDLLSVMLLLFSAF